MGCTNKRMNPKVVQQVNRELDSLMMDGIIRPIKKLNKPWKGKKLGCKPHPPKVVTFCNIMRIMTNRTYDGIESYVELTSEKIKKIFHVDRVPGSSVIHRSMYKLSMVYLRKLIRLIVKEFRKRNMNIAVDSTGFSTTNSSKWFDIKVQKENSRKEYLKLHIAVDVETGIIHQFSITDGRSHDSPVFQQLIKYLPQVEKVMGDGAYSSRENCQLVDDKNGQPFLSFSENATGRAKGCPAWKASFYEFTENEEEWLDEYHDREIVEAVFNSIKQRWNDYISSRKGWLRWRELALKVLVYNTKQMLYCRRAEELGVDLWVPHR